MLTHRCEKSLAKQISIRFCKEFTFNYEGDYPAWRLFHLEENYDYNTKILQHVCEIYYCPFCREKL